MSPSASPRTSSGEPVDDPADDPVDGSAGGGRRPSRGSLPGGASGAGGAGWAPSAWPLLVATHPRQALSTATGLALAALVAGRPLREAATVGASVLVGQAILGWDDDVADRRRDAAHARSGKPVAGGRLEVGTVRFAMACAVLLLVPLALTAGPIAGAAYLGSVLTGLLGTRLLGRGPSSYVPWALAYATYPTVVLAGGWAGVGRRIEVGAPVAILLAVLAMALGCAVHVLRALPGLVDDRAEGQRTLPLRLGLRMGAPRLLLLATALAAILTAALAATLWAVGPVGPPSR